MVASATWLFSFSTQAAVDVRTASFHTHAIDLGSLERNYSSRSFHRGLFGFGWCSPFEKFLDLSKPGLIVLQDCERNEPTLFQSFTSKNGELLKRAGGNFELAAGETRMVFNSQGLLIQLKRPRQVFDLSYDSTQRLRQIQRPQGLLLLEYDRQGHISRLRRGFHDVNYRYQDGNLIQAQSFGSLKIFYQYDLFHNLEKISMGPLLLESIEYDSFKDQVIAHSDPKGCQENYRYEKAENHLLSVLRRRCGHQRSEFHFDFSYERRVDGQIYLRQLHLAQGVKQQDIFFDPYSGASKIFQALPQNLAHRGEKE